LARLLRGVWRPGPWSPDAAELAALAPLAQARGLSGLVWARLPLPLRSTPLGRDFRRAALADAGSAARLDAHLPAVVLALNAVGAEPIVTKGWAVARYFPDPAVRPYADLDLCVRPDRGDAARQALARLGIDSAIADLHVGLPDLPERAWPEVFARTRMIDQDGLSIRVLAPEDQFRLLAVHFVRHVCHRPLWLVDLAVLLEEAGGDMDWESCLRGSHTWRRWLLACAGLAHQLLGARLPSTLAGRRGLRPPNWLPAVTLWHWAGGHEMPVRTIVSRPAEWGPFVANKLLNPVRWCYRLGLPPVRFVPTVWAAAIAARFVQPYPRLWRALSAHRRPKAEYPVHERRLI
jgi:hypothetical protein